MKWRCHSAIHGVNSGLFAALILTGADRLEQMLLGRSAIYAPRAIARRLFGPRARFGRARFAGAQGLALRAVYSAALGACYATERAYFPRPSIRAAMMLAAGIWAFELMTLPTIGAVPPIRAWARKDVALLLAHTFVFGTTAALAYDHVRKVRWSENCVT